MYFKTEQPENSTTFRFSVTDLLVLMALASLYLVWIKTLDAFGWIKYDVWVVVFSTNFIWLGCIVRIMTKNKDKRGLLIFAIGGCITLIPTIPLLFIAWSIELHTRGPGDLTLFLLLISYQGVIIGGLSACVAIGILYLVRKRVTLGVMNLVIGLWPIIYNLLNTR